MSTKKAKIQLNWQCISIKNHVNMIQCFKCQAYGHIEKDCRNKVCCKFCGENHISNTCKTWDFKSCVNCCFKNSKFNMHLQTDHYANDHKCPVFINIKDKLERRFFA
jgi:hypothetical protein